MEKNKSLLDATFKKRRRSLKLFEKSFTKNFFLIG